MKTIDFFLIYLTLWGKIAFTAKVLTIARSELITVIFQKKKSLLFNTEALLTGADGTANSVDPNQTV